MNPYSIQKIIRTCEEALAYYACSPKNPTNAIANDALLDIYRLTQSYQNIQVSEMRVSEIENKIKEKNV